MLSTVYVHLQRYIVCIFFIYNGYKKKIFKEITIITIIKYQKKMELLFTFFSSFLFGEEIFTSVGIFHYFFDFVCNQYSTVVFVFPLLLTVLFLLLLFFFTYLHSWLIISFFFFLFNFSQLLLLPLFLTTEWFCLFTFKLPIVIDLLLFFFFFFFFFFFVYCW